MTRLRYKPKLARIPTEKLNMSGVKFDAIELAQKMVQNYKKKQAATDSDDDDDDIMLFKTSPNDTTVNLEKARRAAVNKNGYVID